MPKTDVIDQFRGEVDVSCVSVTSNGLRGSFNRWYMWRSVVKGWVKVSGLKLRSIFIPRQQLKSWGNPFYLLQSCRHAPNRYLHMGCASYVEVVNFNFLRSPQSWNGSRLPVAHMRVVSPFHVFPLSHTVCSLSDGAKFFFPPELTFSLRFCVSELIEQISFRVRQSVFRYVGITCTVSIRFWLNL